MSRKAAILGCAGPVLGPEEAAFFREMRPAGFILFQRNCLDADQVGRLVRHLRESVDDPSTPVLIDQEGGRVQRLKPPNWRAAPPARSFGDLWTVDADSGTRAAFLNARLIAAELSALGIDIDCAPVLDLPVTGAHDVIGDRAYGSDPTRVAQLGRAVCAGLLAGGVLPVIKHIPGHGRALVDSHEACPVVGTAAAELEAQDLAPFAALADQPLAMTAHVVYLAWDAGHPATLSTTVIRDIIRGRIGFRGALISDDLSMKALGGTFEFRARAAIAAGCDLVLHCNGRLDEMRGVLAGTPDLAGDSAARWQASLDCRRSPEPFDAGAALAELDRLLARVRQ